MCTVRAGAERVMGDVYSKLEDTLAEYLAEFGPDGYDKHTFVDFVVTQIHRPDYLTAFYRKRADALGHLGLEDSKQTLRRARKTGK